MTEQRRVSAAILAEMFLEQVCRPTYRPRKQDVSDFRVMACYFMSDEPFILAVGKTPQQAEGYAKAHRRHIQQHGPDLLRSPRWIDKMWTERWVDGEWLRI